MYDSLDLHHNVRVVSSDIKSRAVSTVPFTTKYIIANYYPFGMQQTGTAGSYDLSSDYRYGYNGKEKDNEIKGEANSLDYGARIYDPRVGKFLSTDPLQLKFPNIFPYIYTADDSTMKDLANLVLDEFKNNGLYRHLRIKTAIGLYEERSCHLKSMTN
jgi:RHS repeat-associated protein